MVIEGSTWRYHPYLKLTSHGTPCISFRFKHAPSKNLGMEDVVSVTVLAAAAAAAAAAICGVAPPRSQ